MKKFAKKLLAFAGVAFTAVAFTSCTKSFCSVQDRANNMANYEKTNLEKINKEAEKNGYLIAQPLFNKFIELKVDAYIEEVEQNANGEPFAYVSKGEDGEEGKAPGHGNHPYHCGNEHAGGNPFENVLQGSGGHDVVGGGEKEGCDFRRCKKGGGHEEGRKQGTGHIGKKDDDP